MRSAEIIYLQDVLGIEGFVRPVSQALNSATNAVKSVVVAMSDVPLVNGRLELLKKMLASIQVHDFIALDCTRDEQAKLEQVQPTAVVYLGENAQRLTQSWAQAEILPVTFTVLPSLEELTDTADLAKLQAIKKDTWARLQTFQKEL